MLGASSGFSASSSILATSVSRIGVGIPSVPMKSPTPAVPLIRNQAFSGDPAVVRGLHLHEHVTGVELAAVDRLLAGADPLDLLGGHLDPADDVGQALLLDLVREGIPHLHLLIRRNS